MADSLISSFKFKENMIKTGNCLSLKPHLRKMYFKQRAILRNFEPQRYTPMTFFLKYFSRNRNLMVPRARTMRFLKIAFDLATIFYFKTFLHMLSQRRNPFCVCSASDEICSAYAQRVMKFVPICSAWIYM